MNHGVSIVIPTYNERENIPPLLKRLDASIERTYEVIIVDDDSPDKTWEKALEFQGQYPLKVIRRTKEKGLSTAVVRGVNESKHEIIVVMDADLQHPPEKVPELVQAIKKGADIAVGSRYVGEGNISSSDFGPLRRCVSWGADFLAKLLLKNANMVKDTQSGFFAFQKDVIEGVSLDPVGYKILLEVLEKGKYEKVTEVGFEFRDREAGESKMTFKNVIDYVHHLGRLTLSNSEFLKFFPFSIIGGIGIGVNLFSLYLLTTFGLFPYFISGVIAIELSFLSNFFLNKHLTFREQGRKIKLVKPLLLALCKDHLVRAGGMGLNLLVLWSFTEAFHLYYMFSQVIGICIGSLWNFAGNKLWTWQ